jgi:hypothetical protein
MPHHRDHQQTVDERQMWLAAERARRAAIDYFKYTEPQCYERRRVLAEATVKGHHDPIYRGRHAVA